MHSLGIAQSILEAALKEAERCEGKRIEAISVKIGDNAFMESDSLQFCLYAIAKGTIAEGARMEVELADSATAGDAKQGKLLSVTLKLG